MIVPLFRQSASLLALVLSFGCLAACPGTPTDDAGVASDSGPEPDSGEPGDSSRSGDSGVVPDAGSPMDAGPGDDGAAPADSGAAPDSATPSSTLTDDFDGDGPLLDYVTNNASALPTVARVGGRYRAELTDNTDNITLHFNRDQGRLDARLVAFPFDVVARNIGIGTLADSQTAPAPSGDPYIFAGIQVHVTDLDQRNSSHIVVGHRGGTHFTVEGKNTNGGSSSVNDVGANTVPDGRADIRVVGNADRTLTIHWQRPNPAPGSTPDDWTAYRETGNLPGTAPAYGPTVYVGLITYAFGSTGVPFVGTCDAIEQL